MGADCMGRPQHVVELLAATARPGQPRAGGGRVGGAGHAWNCMEGSRAGSGEGYPHCTSRQKAPSLGLQDTIVAAYVVGDSLGRGAPLTGGPPGRP